LTFRTAFFTGARLALATVRFAAFALDALRAFPRLAEFPFGSFPRFCTFAFFVRLAMTAPCFSWLLLISALTQHGQVPATEQFSYQQIVL
jgi:hypothetical protein